MRNDYEQQIALECLRIAAGDVERAEKMLAFVNGAEGTDAKASGEVAEKPVSGSRT